MSIAWGSIVLLLLLLPGVLFFVGLYIPEQFTRETTERSPLGQLAAVLLVSFIIHGFLYGSSGLICGTQVPCVDMETVVRTLSLDKPDGNAAHAVGEMLAQHWWWIFSYILVTAVLGVAAGWVTGMLIIQGRLRGLTQHTWVYDLTVGDNFTVAYVMTHVHQDDRVLMYQGFLKAFGLHHDGRFSYIVLTDVARGYMHLATPAPTTSQLEAWRKIGQTPAESGPVSGQWKNALRERSYLVIEGEDVANVVFDRLAFHYDVSLDDLNATIERVQGQLAEQAPNYPQAEGDTAA